jgi:hypothetical protein
MNDQDWYRSGCHPNGDFGDLPKRRYLFFLTSPDVKLPREREAF